MLALIRSTLSKAGLMLRRVEMTDSKTGKRVIRSVVVTDPEIPENEVTLKPVNGNPFPEKRMPSDWIPKD